MHKQKYEGRYDNYFEGLQGCPPVNIAMEYSTEYILHSPFP